VFIGVNLRLAGRLKPQLYKRNPPARVTLREGFAYKILNISLVRAGGLGFYSRVSVAGRDSVHFIRLGLS